MTCDARGPTPALGPDPARRSPEAERQAGSATGYGVAAASA
jgi:hypothetical protein